MNALGSTCPRPATTSSTPATTTSSTASMGAYDATTNPEGGANWQYIAANVRKKSDNSYALPDVTSRTPDPGTLRRWHVDDHRRPASRSASSVGSPRTCPSLVSPGGIADLKVISHRQRDQGRAAALKAGPNGADIVILLVHEGAPDTTLASRLEQRQRLRPDRQRASDANVNAIISGHTHLAYNYDDRRRPVVSAGQYGTNLNELIFTVEHRHGHGHHRLGTPSSGQHRHAHRPEAAIDKKAEVQGHRRRRRRAGRRARRRRCSASSAARSTGRSSPTAYREPRWRVDPRQPRRRGAALGHLHPGGRCRTDRLHEPGRTAHRHGRHQRQPQLQAGGRRPAVRQHAGQHEDDRRADQDRPRAAVAA